MSGSRKQIPLLLCVCLVATLSAATEAVVLVSDSFALNSTNREVGDTLHGVTSEVGGLAWKSGNAGVSPWKFAEGGTASVPASTGEQWASTVKYSPTFGGDVLSVSVDVDYGGYTGSTGYTSIGFNRDDAPSSRYSYNWSIWLQVRGDGSWLLRNGSSSAYLASGSGLTTTGGFHNLKVTYDTVNMKASAWYDGALLATDKTVTLLPTVAYAGFGAAKITSTVQADNFVLAAVPEPMTLSLLALAVPLAAWRRR